MADATLWPGVPSGMPTAEELLLSEGDPFSPAVERRVPPQEDLGCSQQVGSHYDFTNQTASEQSHKRLDERKRQRGVLGGLHCHSIPFCVRFRESAAAFDHLCQTFPDENCVLTSRELLIEVSVDHGFICGTKRPQQTRVIAQMLNAIVATTGLRAASVDVRAAWEAFGRWKRTVTQQHALAS